MELGNCACAYTRQRKGTDHVMSNDTVSFHYVTPGEMYMFDFLLYRLNRHRPPTPTPTPPSTPPPLSTTGATTTAAPASSDSTTNSTSNRTVRAP